MRKQRMKVDEVVEIKKKSNRQLYESFSKNIEKRKRVLSDKILHISNDTDINEIIKDLMNLSGDYKFIDSLQREYEELENIK